MSGSSLRWVDIIRLGLVQAALGSVVVLITSTLNRIMVVEYSLPAILPGALVSLQYLVQIIRPRFGHGSDVGGRRTPWIIGGLVVMVIGSVLCTLATVQIAKHPMVGLPLAVLGYGLVGLGIGAAGTCLLTLLAQHIDARRRAAAATIMWVLMILGIVITATTISHFLDPFSPARLLRVTTTAAVIAFLAAVVAIWRVEPRIAGRGTEAAPAPPAAAGGAFSFKLALRQVWAEPQSRSFTLFVFISMLAYSAQELILEPFAGVVFGYTPGGSAQLSGLQHGGVFLGMISVGIACSGLRRLGSVRAWMTGGCVASAVALAALAGADWVGPAWPLRASVFLLGAANGAFAVAAIGSMMDLANQGRPGRAGVRMGLWGAAQAIAFACGGLFGTSIEDLVRHVSGSPSLAFGIVFLTEAALFLVAAGYAVQIDSLKHRVVNANSTVVTI